MAITKYWAPFAFLALVPIGGWLGGAWTFLLLAGLALGCVFWTWLATRLALRDSGVVALRAE